MSDKKLLEDSWTIKLENSDFHDSDFKCGCEDENVERVQMTCCKCDKPAGSFIVGLNETKFYCAECMFGNNEAKFIYEPEDKQ